MSFEMKGLEDDDDQKAAYGTVATTSRKNSGDGWSVARRSTKGVVCNNDGNAFPQGQQ